MTRLKFNDLLALTGLSRNLVTQSIAKTQVVAHGTYNDKWYNLKQFKQIRRMGRILARRVKPGREYAKD